MQLAVRRRVHLPQLIFLLLQRFIEGAALPDSFLRVVIQMDLHPKPLFLYKIRLSIGLSRPQAGGGAVDQFLSVLVDQFLAEFQMPGKRDNKTASFFHQIFHVLFGVKATVHNKPCLLAADQIIVLYHVFQMGLIRNAAGIDPVIQRQAGFFSVIHPQIDLRQLFFIPVVAPLQALHALAV